MRCRGVRPCAIASWRCRSWSPWPSRPVRAWPRCSAIDRRFEAMMFDWDGTAVPDRHSDAGDLRALDRGAVRGTGCTSALSPARTSTTSTISFGARPGGPGRLLLAVNRGSEIYEVDGDGPHLVHRPRSHRRREPCARPRRGTHDRTAFGTRPRGRSRVAAAEPSEDRPDPAARSGRIRRRHRSTDCSQRWKRGSPPPESPVCPRPSRSRSRRLATRASPIRAVTSDAKHVEIGLTDKSDAARDLIARLWREDGIGPSLVLIAGDELGTARQDSRGATRSCSSRRRGTRRASRSASSPPVCRPP